MTHGGSTKGARIRTARRRLRRGQFCHYCDSLATTLDHIVAKAKGGPDAQWNLVPSCQPCNTAKADTPTWCSCWTCQSAVNRVADRRLGAAG